MAKNTESTPTTRRKYDDDFKAKAVARVNAGETKAAVAEDLGVHVNVLRGWFPKEEGTLAPVSSSGSRTSRGNVMSARNAIMETLLSVHGIKVPESAQIERGAQALISMGREGLTMDDARLLAATVLSAVG